MYYLSLFNFGLYPLVVGYVTLLLALLLMFAMTMLILKIGRIVLVMLKQSMTAPEDRIVKAVQKLSKPGKIFPGKVAKIKKRK